MYLQSKTLSVTERMRFMFLEFDLYINKDIIEVDGKTFKLGELTCDILNIKPDEYDELRALMKKIEKAPTKKDVKELHDLLKKRKIFSVIDTYANVRLAKKYVQIVGDIYAFNQTMFWFIQEKLMKMDKISETKLANELWDFYHHPRLHKMMVNYVSSDFNFNYFDDVKVKYMPRELPHNKKNCAIYEIFTIENFQTFLKIDFMRALTIGHSYRRCRNCGDIFLITHCYKTDYCDKPLKDNPKRTCRQQGAKNIAKEKADNNPILQTYNKAYRRFNADKHRGHISVEDWKNVTAKLRDLRDMATMGKYRDDEFEKITQSEVLYSELGIIKK